MGRAPRRQKNYKRRVCGFCNAWRRAQPAAERRLGLEACAVGSDVRCAARWHFPVREIWASSELSFMFQCWHFHLARREWARGALFLGSHVFGINHQTLLFQIWPRSLSCGRHLSCSRDTQIIEVARHTPEFIRIKVRGRTSDTTLTLVDS
jgi:frataxin-like iron-binding protein CyaY